MIRRREDVLDRHPDWEKYKDADVKMQERAQETKERNRQERPGPVKEELKQEGDEAVKSTTRTYNDTRQYYSDHKMPARKETKTQYWVGGVGKVQQVRGASATLKGNMGADGSSYGSDEQTNLKMTGKEPRTREVKEYNDEGKRTRDDKFLGKGADGTVASVGVIHGDHILMGKRRDNGRWTLPGGHLEKDEDAHEGGKRELKEESGIEADKLKHLKTTKVKTHTGKEKTIHAFKYEVQERPKTSMVNDPDKEVESWKWIKHKGGLPKHVKENLHSPKNVVLEALCIKSKGQADDPNYFVIPGGKNRAGGSINNYREQAKAQGKDFSHGGIATKQQYQTKEKIKDVDYSEETNQSKSYVPDLLKSRPHKYIRKYKGPTGEWVYIYHEGERHHRLTEEDIAAHRHLAEHGEEHERAHHHELVSNIQEMGEEDIGHHRLLAQHGTPEERRHHAAILEAIGHKKSELERTVARAEATDDADKELTGEQLTKAHGEIAAAFKHAKDYLTQHSSTPIAQRLLPILNEAPQIGDQKTIRGMLKKLHESVKRVEQAQGDLTSQNGDVTSNGGTYGNMIYNRAIKGLADKGVIPKEYAEEMKRTARAAEHKPKDLKGIRERAKQRAREEKEREERELGELRGSMAFHMASLMERGGDRVAMARELDQSIKQIFGKSLKKEEWPYNFEAEGLKVKIKSAEARGAHISMSFQVYDEDGNPIMRDWSRQWSKKEGRPHIYNSFMEVRADYRGTAKVGDLINRGQRELMRRQPNGGVVEVTAALDVGGYNWANQGFSFSSPSELNSMRNNFALFCAENGVHLTTEDLQAFTEPVHFAAFTNGKKYIKNVHQYKLTPAQIQSRSLTGSAGEHPLTREEISSGRSTRMACHLGKAYLLGRHWHGTWDSKEENATTRYADAYRALRERAVKHLEANYQRVAQAAQAGERATPQARQVTPRASISTGGGGISERQIQYWSPRIVGSGRTNIRMTAQRIRRVMRWPPDQREHFIRNAPLTPAARRELTRQHREASNG